MQHDKSTCPPKYKRDEVLEAVLIPSVGCPPTLHAAQKAKGAYMRIASPLHVCRRPRASLHAMIGLCMQ